MSLNLQQALNAGSGVNLRGQVGDYFQNFANSIQNQCFNSADVVIDGGQPAALTTTFDLVYAAGGSFLGGTLGGGATILITGETVPVGDACAFFITVDSATKVDVFQSVLCEDIQTAITTLFFENQAPQDGCMFAFFAVFADETVYIPGLTPLDDAGLTVVIQNATSFPILPPSDKFIQGGPEIP